MTLLDWGAEIGHLTYGELSSTVGELAAGLHSRVPPGGVALVLATSELDTVVNVLACFRAGVIALPLTPALSAQGMQRMLAVSAQAGPDVVL